MTSKRKKSESGFTLIELMVVLFVIGILSAVSISYMRGRVDSSKWSEAKSTMGSIHTAARALIGEKGNFYNFEQHNNTLDVVGGGLGFAAGDLDGKYFNQNDYQIIFTNRPPNPPTYIIRADADSAEKLEAPSVPAAMTLDQDGLFMEL